MGSKWQKRQLRLKEKHGWKARPGNNICALNRGAIRFEYPAGWKVDVDDDSLKIRDLPEPDDNCVLAVSQMHLPVDVADRVPLRELVQMSIVHDERDVLECKEVVEIPREDDVEIAYGEVRHLDPKEKREAFGRICMARGSGVYCLMTFEVWTDEVEKYDAVWHEALRSLMLGLQIQDPTVGPVVQ